MKRVNGDLSSQRTQLQIEKALIALLEQRSLDQISVTEICTAALVGRATFYRYFKDKYHLVETLFETALQQLAAEVGVLSFEEGADIIEHLRETRVEAAWVRLFRHFAANSRMYSAMLGGKGSAWFQARMRKALVKLFAGMIQGKRSARSSRKIPLEIARDLFAGATIGIIVAWLEGGMRYSPEQLAPWFRHIAYRGFINALLGRED